MKKVGKTKKYVFGAVLIWLLAAATHAQAIDLLAQRAVPAVPRECQEFSCSCISTNGGTHSGFGGA
jgi:hypothetical protein